MSSYSEFMSDAPAVYRSWRYANHLTIFNPNVGKVEILLDLITLARTIAALPGASLLAMEKEEIVSVIETFVRGHEVQGPETAGYDVEAFYDVLSDWRKTRIRPTGHGVEPATITYDDYDAHLALAHAIASQREDQPAAPAQTRTPPPSPVPHQTSGPSPAPAESANEST